MQGKNHQQDFISRAGTIMTFAAWLIFLVILFGIFDYSTSQRSNPNQNIVTAINGLNKEVTLQRNAYGHYVSNGTINNQEVTFLLDTGATEIAIPEHLANRIVLTKGRNFIVKTTHGNVKQ